MVRLGATGKVLPRVAEWGPNGGVIGLAVAQGPRSRSVVLTSYLSCLL